MSHVYVLTNQHQQFLSKSNEWIDGRENTKLFRTEYKDVAINQMFEANTRNVSLRIELLECALDTKKHPQIPADALSDEPLPGEEVSAENAASTGDPDELPQPAPSETPPEYNPEADPEPAPEVAPQPQPEVNPEQFPGTTPEVEPNQPPESVNTQA
ncbi:hypothetical protein [Microbulbifer hydrolyticus]|uniref:Outer membrane biosynthesis protein TonB n=1 Tax=Microbulbifer hydrolyticus TaxID=48074 RepID=A0A6P1T6I0_9GAMM|nr:hypothetical protein [Microbulbifer hydrolyticus]MBB5211628.1 outer membrane biosynthesis protein TonB [Microbulbifer hydrolyticus]QHQ37637.1 hypothetical protein GTQ55_00675 [Microbulbifer hydrolyticus]